MTTFVNFSQPPDTPFSFQATFDGTLYTVSIPWNLAGQRLYLSVTQLDGTPVIYGPCVESPIGFDINLLYGYFKTSTLVWRVDNAQFEITP